MTIRNWGFAAGLVAALALVGTAQAQSAGTGNQMGGTTQESTTPPDTTGTAQPGERSGWSGREANRTGGTTQATPGGQADATGGTAGAGSTGAQDTPSGGAAGTSSDRPAARGGDTGASGTGSTGATAGTATGSTGATAGQTGQKMDKDLQEKIQKIHASNKAEIHMAQMGAQKAQSPEVKQFAEKLEQDHQKLDEKLTSAAQSAGVQLSGKDYDKQHDKAMKDMDKLQKKTGMEFDREFMSHMVKDHEKDLKDVKSAARDAEKGNHTELASVLNSAEQGMQGHKDQAEQIRDSLKGEKGASRAQGPGGTAAGSTGAGSTGAAGGMGAGSTGQTTPSGGAEGTSSDRPADRGGDTGQAPGNKGEKSGERKY